MATKDKSKVNACQRRYYHKHRGKVRAYRDGWAKDHPERVKGYCAAYNARNRIMRNLLSNIAMTRKYWLRQLPAEGNRLMEIKVELRKLDERYQRWPATVFLRLPRVEGAPSCDDFVSA